MDVLVFALLLFDLLSHSLIAGRRRNLIGGDLLNKCQWVQHSGSPNNLLISLRKRKTGLTDVVSISYKNWEDQKYRMKRGILLSEETKRIASAQCNVQNLIGEKEFTMSHCFNKKFNHLYQQTRRTVRPRIFSTRLTLDAITASKQERLNELELKVLTDVLHQQSSSILTTKSLHKGLKKPSTLMMELYSSVLEKKNVKTVQSLMTKTDVISQLLKDVERITKMEAFFQKNDTRMTSGSLDYKLSMCSSNSFNNGTYYFGRQNDGDNVIIQNITKCGKGTIFTSIQYQTLHYLLGMKNFSFGRLNSKVITTSIYTKTASETQNNIVVRIRLKHLKKTRSRSLGVFLNLSQSVRWDTTGCKVKESREDYTDFYCNHLTNFAVMVTGEEEFLGEEHLANLRLISDTGCFISLVGLVATLACFAITRIASSRRLVIINMTMCLAIAQITFIAGVEKAKHSKVLCTMVAIALHYFYTAAMLWMMALGIHLYYITTRMRPRASLSIKKMAVFTYVSPGVELSIALVITKGKGFGTSSFCWLSAKNGVIWIFLVPVVVTVMMNSLFLVFVLKKFMGTKRMQDSKLSKKTRSMIRAILVLTPLLGLTWISGIVAEATKSIALTYVFVLSNSIQGLLIFVSSCVVDSKIRSALSSKIHTSRSS